MTAPDADGHRSVVRRPPGESITLPRAPTPVAVSDLIGEAST